MRVVGSNHPAGLRSCPRAEVGREGGDDRQGFRVDSIMIMHLPVIVDGNELDAIFEVYLSGAPQLRKQTSTAQVTRTVLEEEV